MSDTTPDPLVGRTLAGRYRVLRRLQEGGMGAIYIASQEPLGREVALKVLKEAYAADATAIARFEKEARAVSRLAHPHIVTIYDFGHTEDKELFLAMELLRGSSLRQVLEREKRIDWRRSLRMMRGVVMGLVEAHRGGIMHRDLKPENVMLVEQAGDPEFVKLLDFGLARSTQRNMIPGTPNYISPERVNGVANDLRSDLYSLGAMWFELLTGRIPFEADSSIKIIVRHLQDPPPRPSEHGADPEMPRAVDDLVLRLLQKQPDARPPSAQALLAELTQLEGAGPWSVASAAQIGDRSTQTPDLGGWSGEQSVDFDFSPVSGLASLASLEDEEPVEPIELLTRRKGAAHQGAPLTPEAQSAPAPNDTSDAAVMLLTRVKVPKPAAERRVIHSIAEVSTSLAEARSVEEVARLTVDYLRGRFTRAAVLDMRERPLRVLDVFGTHDAVEVEAAFERATRLEETVAGGEAYYGRPKVGDDWAALHQQVGGTLPGGVLLAALRRNKRPALLIYADHDAPTLMTDLSEPARLLKEIAAALTMLRF